MLGTYLAITATLLAVGCTQDDLTCDVRSDMAAMHVDAAVQANRACTVDSDCTVTSTDTDCHGSCSEAVAQSGTVAVAAAIEEANASYCVGFRSGGCSFITPGCLALALKCEQGACTFVMP